MEPPPDPTASRPSPRTATLVLIAASIFELTASSLICGHGHCGGLPAYSVAVGTVSLTLLAPVALVLFAEPLAPQRLPDGLPHLSLLLLAWWLPASFLLTFVGPFQGLSNGYFSTIVAGAGSVQLCRANVPLIDGALSTLHEFARNAPEERSLLCMLGLSSTAVWVQAAVCASQYGDYMGVKAWAIIVGVVSFMFCAFYLLLDEAPSHRLAIASLLAAWWVQGVGFSFVPDSFTGTMNGFVSTWASAGLAFHFLRTTRITRDLAPIPSAEPDDDGFGTPTTSYHAHAADATDGFSSGFDGMGGGNSWANKAQQSPPLLPAGSLQRPTPDAFRHTDEGL